MTHYKSSILWLALGFTVLLPAGTFAAGVPMSVACTNDSEVAAIQSWHQLPDDDKVANNEVYDIERVDVKPQFPGGNTEFLKLLNEQIKYPSECLKRGVQGRVFIRFVVEKDGTIGDIEILRSPDSALSEEAKRVLKLMPKWEPGQKDGKTVATRFSIPVNFRIQEPVKKKK